MDHELKEDIERLKQQMIDLQEWVKKLSMDQMSKTPPRREEVAIRELVSNDDCKEMGSIFYSGRYQSGGIGYRWEPQERSTEQLIDTDSDKMSRVLAALGNKQRLDILRTLLKGPLSGAELVEQLQMGTTGQLYHHLKALLGANLVIQDKGGRYTIPSERILPFLLLLTGVCELVDASDFIKMMEVRDDVEQYLGKQKDRPYDAHLLLWAIVENSLLEHSAGHGSEVHIFLHADGSATIADNGRGIPTKLLPQTNTPVVQSVLTDIDRLKNYSSFKAQGANKGMSIAVVNALSSRLTVEIRRTGKIYRQDYKNGIPQTELMEIGVSNETGTSITFRPDHDLFSLGFNEDQLERHVAEMKSVYPELTIQLHR